MTSKQCVVPRSGAAPLKFEGILLAENNGQQRGGVEQTRWHVIRIYALPGREKHVLTIAYRTTWGGEEDRNLAVAVGGLHEVAQALRDYVPEKDVRGYPDREGYREKQQALLHYVRQRWEGQVSEALAAAGLEEVVQP